METTIDRTIQPLTKEISKIDVPHAKKHMLDNGIPVYAINAGFQDLVKIEFIFPNPGFNIDRPLVNSAANRMMSEGTSKYTGQQLADHIDYYGAFFETDENFDFTSIMLYTLNKHLASTLPFVNDIISDPVFPEKELVTYIQNNKQRLVVDNEKVNSVARRKFNEVIFGGKHPYGYYVHTSDYDNIKRNHLIEHHRAKYIAANCTIIISGIIKDDSIALLNKIFGKTSNNTAKTSNGQLISFAASTEKKHLVNKEDAVQSAIRIGKPFFNRKHEDYPGAAVVNTILGGYFGSRLMTNIREDKGYTYGIGSGIVSMKQDGYFFISTEVGADVTNSALEEIYKEIKLLQSEAVERDELEIARNYMLGTFLKGIDGAFQLAERFKSIYLYELDYSYYDRYLQKLRTIEADEIQALARKYFEVESLFELVAGKR